MSPILGVIASSTRQGLVSANSYESIATYNIGAGGTTSVTFSSIPQTYKHLQLRGIAKGIAGSNNASLGIQVNGDTSSNQAPFHQLYADGSTISASGGASSDGYTASLLGPVSASGQTTFAGFVIDILDYTDTNKYKTIRSLAGADFSGSGFVSLRSSFNKNSTSAITTFNIITYNSGGTAGFAQYSSFALYGIKG